MTTSAGARAATTTEQQARSRVDTTVAFSSEGTIDLSNLSGDIVVTGWSRREAQIKATSERGRLELDVSSSRITLEEEGRGSMWGGGRRGETRYEVSVPRGVRVIARSTSGDVTVRGTGGEVEASSTSGDVQVEDAVRRIELTSVSGDVTARQLKGTVEATSVSGNVELDERRRRPARQHHQRRHRPHRRSRRATSRPRPPAARSPSPATWPPTGATSSTRTPAPSN